MWARIIELMLGCWLVISPFIFEDGSQNLWKDVNDWVCGSAVAVFALLSYVPKLEKIHLATLAISLWMIGVAVFGADPPPPPRLQNLMVVGLFLMMFALVPSWAATPPSGWSEFYGKNEKRPDCSSVREVTK